jgi:mannose-6-phosphate isomerase-like protein (cupin superfamily)
MRTLLKVGFGMLVLAFALIAMSYSMLRAEGTAGSSNPEGRMVDTETRDVAASVTSIDLTGPIDLTLRQGAVPSLTVRGEKRMLGNIETIQSGDTLEIATKGMLLHHRNPLQVVLVLPSLESVSINGSGSSTVNGFIGDKANVELHGAGNLKFNGRYREVVAGVHGSGDVEVNGGASEKVAVEVVGSGQMTVVGSTEKFKVEQTGSGDLNARHLAAREVDVELMGSGTSIVQAREVAAISLRGSGDVTVHGAPSQRSVSRTGSGDVTFR